MRKFKSHKIVEAESIASIWDGGRRVTLSDGTDVFVPPDVFSRGHPSPGDYLIRYEDGYISWSPKAAFESGYDEMKNLGAEIRALGLAEPPDGPSKSG